MAEDLLSLPSPTPEAFAKLDLSPVKLIQDGWEFIKPHYLETMGLLFGAAIVSGALSRLPLIGGLISIVAGAALSAGLIYFLLERYRGNPVGLDAALVPLREKAVDIVIAHVVALLIAAVGFVFLFVPGLIAMALFSLALPLVVLTRTTAIDALKRSFELTKPHAMSLTLCFAMFILVNALGAIPCGLGLLVTFPATVGGFVLLLARVFGVSRQAALPAP